jgi:hypothetical protein
MPIKRPREVSEPSLDEHLDSPIFYVGLLVGLTSAR